MSVYIYVLYSFYTFIYYYYYYGPLRHSLLILYNTTTYNITLLYTYNGRAYIYTK